MFGNQWHKKEKPLPTMIGIGGGATSLVQSGAASADPIVWGGDRGVFAGGWDDTGGDATTNVIDYINITTTGNATDFGDTYNNVIEGAAGCSNGSRGLQMGGGWQASRYDYIAYVTISTPGNAQDFGNLEGVKNDPAACSNGPRGVCAGGDDGSNLNIIEYVTIANTGNASDFGDLTQARERLG